MQLMTDKNSNEVIGFIASTVEQMRDQMATKSDIGGLQEATTAILGDIEQVQLRLDGIEHSMSSRFEHVEGGIKPSPKRRLSSWEGSARDLAIVGHCIIVLRHILVDRS